MNFKDFDNIHEFLEAFSKVYGTIDHKKEISSSYDDYKLGSKEFLYVIDFSVNEITYSRGFKSYLGFDDNTLSLVDYMNLIHPDDLDLVTRIGKACILFSTENYQNSADNVLYLVFRLKDKQGVYRKVLSQSSIFETDNKGLMISSMVKVSDLSFMEDDQIVRYNFIANKLDQEKFKRQIYNETFDLFSPRELEIIHLISKGLPNHEIAKNLRISPHTVSTHRKNIMRKSACHSRQELLVYCRRHNII